MGPGGVWVPVVAGQVMCFRALHKNPTLLLSQCMWAHDGYSFTLLAFAFDWDLA